MLIRQHAVPVMKAAGFTKKGRTFRLAAGNGDHLFLQFDTHAVDPGRHVFDVTFSVVPLPYWEFLKRQHVDPPAPDAVAPLPPAP